MEARYKIGIRRTAAASTYQHGLCAAFFAKRAAEAVPLGYAILTEAGTLAQAPREVLQSLEYLDSLLQQSHKEFLEFMQSNFQEKNEL